MHDGRRAVRVRRRFLLYARRVVDDRGSRVMPGTIISDDDDDDDNDDDYVEDNDDLTISPKEAAFKPS